MHTLKDVDGLPNVEQIRHIIFDLLVDCQQRRELIEATAFAFAHGNKKYGLDNWKTSEWKEADKRTYFGAICRHLVAADHGEEMDPESGLPHIAHALAGALIYIWHELKSQQKDQS